MRKNNEDLLKVFKDRPCLTHWAKFKLLISHLTKTELMKNLHTAKLAAKAAISLSLLLLTLNFYGCVSSPQKTSADITGSISIMSYNVENLFDTVHDEGKEDYTFLPRKKKSDPIIQKKCKQMATRYWRKECLETDWTEDVVETKLTRIADTVLQIDGKGPDILILVEVENKKILDELNDDYLKAAHYKTAVLIEGEDERGIDVAVLSRFELANTPTLHKMPIERDGKPVRTRGVLQVPLKMADGKTINVLGVHFPSQHGPTDLRLQGAQFLNKLVREIPAGQPTIAGGDFNISAPEESKNGIYATTLAKNWKVSQLVGCKECEGSYNHRGKWNFFDALLFSDLFSVDQEQNYSVISASITTPKAGKFQVNEDGVPQRFHPEEPLGVSDHLPIFARFKLKTGSQTSN